MSEENTVPPEGAPDPGTADPQAQANQPAPEGAIENASKWKSFEIVDGKAVPIEIDAATAPGLGAPTFYVRHPDDTYSVADPQPVLIPAPPDVSPTLPAVHLLDRARALPELVKGEAAELIAEGIQAFKDIEGRTMNVVHRFGQLFKQEK